MYVYTYVCKHARMQPIHIPSCRGDIVTLFLDKTADKVSKDPATGPPELSQNERNHTYGLPELSWNYRNPATGPPVLLQNEGLPEITLLFAQAADAASRNPTAHPPALPWSGRSETHRSIRHHAQPYLLSAAPSAPQTPVLHAFC